MNNKNFRDKYYFYDGTTSLEGLEETIAELGLPKSKCYFVQFLNQYYAIFYDTFTKEVVIGENKIFYSKNGRLEEGLVGEVAIDFPINSRNNDKITDTLARELALIDENLDIYYYPNINSKQIKKANPDIKLSKYVVLLALTFCSKFYEIDNLKEMTDYFILTPELKSFFTRTKSVTAIDPFSQQVLFKDGSTADYSIRFYMEPGTFKTKATFALTSKNKFAPQPKRKWLSIAQYQQLYPDEFIMYEKPDFRTDKSTCKWCGKKLPEGKKSYCSNNCKTKFFKATDIAKGEILPYKILCRDKFICQCGCGKDMALINEHGVKIPTSKLCSIPDKDGKHRRDCEVHHMIHVENGGSDNQHNLTTRSRSCHKNEHKIRKKRVKIVSTPATLTFNRK